MTQHPTEMDTTPRSGRTTQMMDALTYATHLNPKAAKFFAGGVIVLLLATLVISFSIDLDSVIIVAVLIFILSGIFALFQIVNQNPLQRAILSWAATLAIIALLAGFLNSALPWPRIGNPTEPGCYWKSVFGLQSRKLCEAQYSVTIDEISSLQVPRQFKLAAATGPERLWLTQSTDATATQAPEYSAQNPYSAGTIDLQISDQVPQDSAVKLGKELDGKGWPISGGQDGVVVVKTKDAPDNNEVRYFNEDDKAAAIALAQQLHDLNPVAPVKVKDFSSLGRVGSQGTLEIWLNDIAPPGTGG